MLLTEKQPLRNAATRSSVPPLSHFRRGFATDDQSSGELKEKDLSRSALVSQKDQAMAKKDEVRTKKEDEALTAAIKHLIDIWPVRHNECHLLKGIVKGKFARGGVFPFFSSRISTF